MSAFTLAFSAALIHLVWQGAVVAILLWALLLALRNRSANARYAASCAALATLAVLPILTTAVLYEPALPIDVRAGAAIAPSPRAAGEVVQTLASVRGGSALQQAWLARLQAWALPLWSLGVLLFSLRLVSGSAHAFRLGRRGESADASIVTIVARLAGRMGVDRPVRVLISTLADGPSVVGWLRPVLLLPPATAMGLTPQQLEAVLAHELAHIRRHDYLVNILQMVAETLLFYHPAVWWTSRQIRRERELCCDDLAVRGCGDALCYARALTSLEKMRGTVPTLAMGATAGPLLHRIQRVLGSTPHEYGPSRWPGVLAIGLALGCVALNVNWVRVQAQTQAAARPQFEVASIKPNTATDRGLIGGGCHGTDGGGSQAGIGALAARAGARASIAPIPLGTCRLTRSSLKWLMQIAYGFFGPNAENMIDGGPPWLDNDRYDVLAKAEKPTTEAQLKVMLQNMLADRFKLAFHHETRDVQGFALVVSANGSKLKEGPSGGARGGLGRMMGGPLTGRNATTAQLADVLSRVLGRPVIDKTGLRNAYNFTLTWTPGENEGRGGIALLPPEVAADLRARGLVAPSDPSGPSIFTAVQEQLGLKLESQKAPVEVIVIDHAERPTED